MGPLPLGDMYRHWVVTAGGQGNLLKKVIWCPVICMEDTVFIAKLVYPPSKHPLYIFNIGCFCCKNGRFFEVFRLLRWWVTGDRRSIALRSDWLSVQIVSGYSGWLVVAHSIATCMAAASSANDEVNTAPRRWLWCRMVGAAGSPQVTITPAPPSLVPAEAEPSV